MSAAGRVRGAVLLAVLAAMLPGCAALVGGEAPVPTFHVWRDTGASAPAAQVSTRTLLVGPTATATFYDTERIAFSRAEGTRAYYQLAAWTDRPGRRFDVLLLERLERRGAFAQVAATTAGTRGDFVLSASILEIYHDSARAPGLARLRISVELTDRAPRALVARRAFEEEVPVAAENPAAAVASFDTAVARVLDALMPWLEKEAARQPGVARQ